MGDSPLHLAPPNRRSPSIAIRALLALVLMVGFYVLALAIAFGILALVYQGVVSGARVPVRFLICGPIFAGMILWSVCPRIDRFVAPGPRLLPEKHPRLFAEIQAVARATNQEMPAEVYLESEVNAWVAQRGGIMGVGGRRIMGLGLALMRTLSTSEFRAVLAHEFGHFHGGDTRLGPWVYKTRSAMGRTINTLSDTILQKPFLWYGNIFLRVTHAVSRQQEFTADRLAATVVGKDPLTTGLRKVHGAGLAFNPFWRNEMVPVLSAGFRPPLAEGFARFLQASTIASAIDESLQTELREGKTDPYDTHPPLLKRIAAVADLPARAPTAAEVPAISLLDDLPALERGVLAAIAGPAAAAKLADTSWENVGPAVYVPLWQKLVADSGPQLRDVTPESLPDTVVPGLKAAGDNLPDATQQRIAAIGAALTLAALHQGAALECEPGLLIIVTRGELRVEPFNVLARLVKGELTAADWRTQCDALAITGTPLSSPAAATVPPA